MPRKRGGWRKGRRGGGNSGKNVLAGPFLPFISWAACRDGVFPPLSPLADQMKGGKSYNPPPPQPPPRPPPCKEKERKKDQMAPRCQQFPPQLEGNRSAPQHPWGAGRYPPWLAKGTSERSRCGRWGGCVPMEGTALLHSLEPRGKVTSGPGEQLPRVPLCRFLHCARPFRAIFEQIA